MSDQEQYLIGGKALAEYAAVRRELAALVAKGAAYARSLHIVAAQFSPNTADPHQASYDFGAHFTGALAQYPNRPDIEELAREIAAATARKRELAKTLRDLGVEPKE
jgi:hypothetical protein